MLNGKKLFVEYLIIICNGFLSILIFVFVVNYEIDEVKVDECVYFFYFSVDNVEG